MVSGPNCGAHLNRRRAEELPPTNVVDGPSVNSVEAARTKASNEIEPTPDFGTEIDTSSLLGLAKIKGQLEPLLNSDRAVAPETVQALAAAM